MQKYRIVEIIRNQSDRPITSSFQIEHKSMFHWNPVRRYEANNTTKLYYETYKDAEIYLYNNYINDGVTIKFNNEYHFTPYTMQGFC